MRSAALRKPAEEAEPQRKPATSEAKPVRTAGHFSLVHSLWSPMCEAADGSHTLIWLLGHIMSLANQRACDGTVNGWTGPVTTGELAERYHCSEEAVEWAVRRGKGVGGVGIPLLEQKAVAEAEAEGIVRRGERGRRRGAYVLRVLMGNWEKAARAVASRHEESEPEGEETENKPPERVELFDKPLTLTPGERSRPVPFSAAARRALRSAAEFDPGELSVSVELRPVIENGLFRLEWKPQSITAKESQVVSDQQNGFHVDAGTGKSIPDGSCVDCNNGIPLVRGSGLHASGQRCSDLPKPQSITDSNSQLLCFLDSVFSEVGIAKSPAPALVSAIQAKLNGTRLERYERIVRERLKEGGKVYPKLFLKLAEDAAYTQQVRGPEDKASAKPPLAAGESRMSERERLAWEISNIGRGLKK